MSVEHMSAVLHHSRAKGTAKLVLLGIANHQGDGGAWPAVSTLARYANVDRSNVQRALAKLVGLGELVIHHQEGGTAGLEDHERPNLYDVMVRCPPWCDRTPNHRDTRGPNGGQLSLWKNRAALAPPGRVSAAPPGRVSAAPPAASARPKPSINPPTNPVPESQPHPETARVWCARCGLAHLGRRHADGHEFAHPRGA